MPLERLMSCKPLPSSVRSARSVCSVGAKQNCPSIDDGRKSTEQAWPKHCRGKSAHKWRTLERSGMTANITSTKRDRQTYVSDFQIPSPRYLMLHCRRCATTSSGYLTCFAWPAPVHANLSGFARPRVVTMTRMVKSRHSMRAVLPFLSVIRLFAIPSPFLLLSNQVRLLLYSILDRDRAYPKMKTERYYYRLYGKLLPASQ